MQKTKAFWFAVLMAVVAMFMLHQYVSSRIDEVESRYGDEQSVVVASTEIKEMGNIRQDMLRLKSIPKKFVSPNSVRNVKDLEGAIAAIPIHPGEQITQTMVVSPGVKTGLSHQVSMGHRAITLPVDSTRGVGGMIRPGDRIDILSSVKTGDGLEQGVTVRTIAQWVYVLAVGNFITNNPPRIVERTDNETVVKNISSMTMYRHLTVEVTPLQAQQLAWLVNKSASSLYFTLRRKDDEARPKLLPSTTSAEILGKGKKQTPARRAAPATGKQPQKKVYYKRDDGTYE